MLNLPEKMGIEIPQISKLWSRRMRVFFRSVVLHGMLIHILPVQLQNQICLSNTGAQHAVVAVVAGGGDVGGWCA